MESFVKSLRIIEMQNIIYTNRLNDQLSPSITSMNKQMNEYHPPVQNKPIQ